MTAIPKLTPKQLKAARAASAAKRSVLTLKQWAEVTALWENGGVTLADLAAKFGCAVSTFERHFKKHAVVKGAKVPALKKKIDVRLENASIDEATILAARIKETKESHYTMVSNLGKLAWNEILQTKKDGAPLAVAMNNLKSIDIATNILKKVREERYAVLGLDRPDAVDPAELPELVISELTAEQIQELRDRDHSEMDEFTKPLIIDDDDDSEDEDDSNGVIEEN